MIKIKEEMQDIKKHYGFTEMSDEDVLKIYNFEKRRKEENNNLIELSFSSLIYDGQYMEKTKPVEALLVIDDRIIPIGKVTTWAKLLREVNETVKPYQMTPNDLIKGYETEDSIKDWFEESILDFIKENRLGMNGNFSTKLFDDDSFINSRLYLSNQNHKLEIFDWGENRHICAVYPTEVIVVLYGLMCISNGTIFIRYVKRDELSAQINEDTESIEYMTKLIELTSSVNSEILKIEKTLDGLKQQTSAQVKMLLRKYYGGEK